MRFLPVFSRNKAFRSPSISWTMAKKMRVLIQREVPACKGGDVSKVLLGRTSKARFQRDHGRKPVGLHAFSVYREGLINL